MRFFAKGEYRGKESKVSGKGNEYYQLIFEDPDSGEQLRCFSELHPKYEVSLEKLVKGTVYGMFFHYHYDYGRWHLDLVNLKDVKEG